MSKLYNVLLVLCLACGTLGENNYEGYKLYQITPKTEDQVEFLHQLDSNGHFDFLRHSRLLGDNSEVIVAPEIQDFFENTLINFTASGLEYKITVENVREALETETAPNSTNHYQASSSLFTEFVSHAVMNEYLLTLERLYPHIVQVESIGRTFEGRDLLLIKIGANPNNPTILVDAGIHAREWIAPPVALYIINQLVENPANYRLYQNVNWNIIPSLNPDGYEFSRSSTWNRLWRKTRQPNQSSTCIGTDPNRNFEYYWMFAGASADPCDEIYAGPQPFSEPETAALATYALRNRDQIKLYISFHSYGNMILYPWGYTNDLPDNAEELQWLGELAGLAIGRVSTLNSRYVVGSSTNVLYAAAGGSDDWVKGVTGVGLAYTIELPAGGLFGFNPPATSILPIVQETFEGITIFHAYVEAAYSKN
ncbi:carboxypeptidase B-like [Sitophilus oryzae]|uniref:Carboxypeptidase B-like n=1 Tax=Sitophilus oryzae TaxID=7048 RepID=A0A6J2YNV1_SITOR|nr:carboxypeptidase B-like [Sitophilus oryzae]